MTGMAETPDKYYDLACIDPPYGSEGIERTGGTWANKIDGGVKIKKWDYKPDKSFFTELFRISKNQIIWGGNYFGLPPNRHYLIWKKHIPENFTVGMCEYAWSSFNLNPKVYEHPSNNEINRFHPTQKPVKLYAWIYHNYLPDGGRVLDTHLGSGSNRIAAHKAGNIDFTGYEIDKDYFEAQEKRWKIFIAQQTINFT